MGRVSCDHVIEFSSVLGAPLPLTAIIVYLVKHGCNVNLCYTSLTLTSDTLTVHPTSFHGLSCSVREQESRRNEIEVKIYVMLEII